MRRETAREERTELEDRHAAMIPNFVASEETVSDPQTAKIERGRAQQEGIK